MQSDKRTRKRFVFYKNSELRAIKIWKDKRISWKRNKIFGYIAAVSLFLFVSYFFFPELDFKRPLPLDTAPEDSRKSDYMQEKVPKRYSVDALSSKPKTQFKLNEQVCQQDTEL